MEGSLPSCVARHHSFRTGNGLLATKSFEAGAALFHIGRPIATILDTAHLQDTCAHCCAWLADETGNRSVWQSVGSSEDTEGDGRKLRSCLGCKVVKYCSKACQSQSWKESHRYECKIFSRLFPNVLPNTVRLVLRLLLLRAHSSLSDSDWERFFALESHVSEFRAQQTKNSEGLTTWQTIELMSKAASTYSGTKESPDTVQGMLARVMTNTHTLTTPTLDPLGLCLSLSSALLNHSCTPDAYIVFSGPSLYVRSLSPIKEGDELRISYIDTSQETKLRQSELQERYFFTCTCTACIHNLTFDKPDPDFDQGFRIAQSRALSLQAEASTVSSSPSQEVGSRLEAAIEMLRDYPPYRQPSASIRHNAFLNAIATRGWPAAMHHALVAYFHIEPVQYPLPWHPVRVVRKWVLLRLVIQVAGAANNNDASVQPLSKFEIKWTTVIQGLWREISDAVRVSHGVENQFTEEVRIMGSALGVADAPRVESSDLEMEWTKLRKVAEKI